MGTDAPGRKKSTNMEVFKWALATGWSLNKAAFVVWSLIAVLGALLPAFVISNIGRIIDKISGDMSIGTEFRDILALIVILGSLYVLQSSYHVTDGVFSPESSQSLRPENAGEVHPRTRWSTCPQV